MKVRRRLSPGVQRRIVSVLWRNPISQDRSEVLLDCGHQVLTYRPDAREAWCHQCPAEEREAG